MQRCTTNSNYIRNQLGRPGDTAWGKTVKHMSYSVLANKFPKFLTLIDVSICPEATQPFVTFASCVNFMALRERRGSPPAVSRMLFKLAAFHETQTCTLGNKLNFCRKVINVSAVASSEIICEKLRPT
jgi:hypothetical protein